MPRCPTCKRPLPEPLPKDTACFAPFCSQRCKLADLHGWLNDRYVISEALAFDETEGRLPTPTEDE